MLPSLPEPGLRGDPESNHFCNPKIRGMPGVPAMVDNYLAFAVQAFVNALWRALQVEHDEQPSVRYARNRWPCTWLF